MFETPSFSFTKYFSSFSWQKIVFVALLVAGLTAIIGGSTLWWISIKQPPVSVVSEEEPVASRSAVIASSSAVVKTIYIDISGAVKQPGLYQLPLGSRVAAAVTQAGGFTKDADTQYVSQELNLAQVLQDGDKLYIPTNQEQAQRKQLAQQTSSAGADDSSLVSLNTGTQAQLEALPKIGSKRADDIIAHRPYAATSELVAKGIVTQSIWDEIQSLVRL